jgi:glucan phosphoethanolaminetransferase (alkaline phosphatase superfamily)
MCNGIKKIYTAKFVNERSIFYYVPLSVPCFNMSLPTIIYISTEYQYVNKWLASLFTHNVFKLLIYLCGAIFVFVFLVNVFNKEINYMINNC